MISRGLMLAGALATLVAAFVPWVSINGLDVSLDLGLVGAQAGAGNRTVAGTDTALWPVLVVLAIAVAALALLGIARRVVLVIGLLVAVGGVLLLIYMAGVIDFETRDNGELQRAVAKALLSSSVGPGTPLLLGGGVAIAAGALLRR